MPAIRDIREIAALVRTLVEGPNDHRIEYLGIVEGSVVFEVTTTDADGRQWVNVLRLAVPEGWLPWIERLVQDLADSYGELEVPDATQDER